MTTFLAGAGVMLAAFYLVGFGAIALLVPSRASRYLHGFASSARVHLLELIARLTVGAAFMVYAPDMHFAVAFHIFGWILIITTLGLAVLPWRWHQRFARATVPAVRPYLPVVGIASVAAGAFVCWAVASVLLG